MSGLDDLIGQLAKIGAPVAAGLLRSYGGKGGEMAGWLIEQLAGSVGVKPDPKLIANEIRNNPISEKAIVALDSERGDQWTSVYQSGIAGQFALAQSENKKGGWAANWRPGWMYLLGLFWVWTIILVPIVNAIAGSKVETIEIAILLTLTSWFIALYMGGHTVKELGKNALDAIKAMRES